MHFLLTLMIIVQKFMPAVHHNMPSKKLLILTQNLSTGGVQNIVTKLANTLAPLYECTLVLLEANKRCDYILPHNIRIDTLDHLSIDITQKGVGIKLFNFRKDALQKYVNQLNPDLIFSHEDYHNILSLHIKSSALRLLTSHISLQNFYSTHRKIHLLEKDFYFENIKNLYPKASKVICVSRVIEEEIRSISKGTNTITIHNGIDHNAILKSLSQKRALDYKYILNIGRLHPQKGQKDLLYAYHKVHQDIPQKLVIIGDGPLKKELNELIISLKLEKKVFLLGNIKAPYRYMADADFCITPSYQEGFSIVVLEMMLTSALISARYDGYQEVLKDYGNLFDSGDIQMLSDLIQHYANHKKATHTLSLQHTKDVQSFPIEATIQNYTNLINYIFTTTGNS